MGSHRSGWYTMVLVTACAIAFGACKKTEPGAHTGSHTAPTTAPAADSHAPSTAGHAPSAAGAAPHWEYEGMAGPTAWGALSPEFATCSAGLQQSPIDIPGASPAVTAQQRAAFPPAEVETHASARPVSAVHNGHTIQVDFPKGDTLTVGGVPFELAQFHFHAPSEHTFAGRHLPMEIHFVHRSAAGKLAVLGVLVEQGAPNAAFGSIDSALPKAEGAAKQLDPLSLNVGDLLPKSRAISRYDGSLTTPPCSEQVSWFVMTAPIELSAEQISTVSTALPDNSRPVQPPNGRQLVSDELAVRNSP